MVSRSLEKMMLIAVGLSTAVIIGVPVLLYAIDTMSYSTQLQTAQNAAAEIINGISSVDILEDNNLTIQVQLSSHISVDVSGTTITIGVLIQEQLTTWHHSYDHSLVLSNAPTAAGVYSVYIELVSDVIHITFTPL